MRLFSTSLIKSVKISALSDRLEKILNEKVTANFSSSIIHDHTLPQENVSDRLENPKLEFLDQARMNNDSQSHLFRQKYVKEIGYVRSEKLLNSKDYEAVIEPWAGKERIEDTALRMLIDSAPKALKVTKRKTLFTAPKRLDERISNAKEGSLDYKLCKTLSVEEKEKEHLKEIYKEKLIGPTMFADFTSSNSAVDLIGNMASARINAAIDRDTGRFNSPNMKKVRGKPLDRERLANSTNSNYFMNQILKNQECLPTWIENQQGIDKGINTFRIDLERKMLQVIIDYVSRERGPGKSNIIQFLRHPHLQEHKDSLEKTFIVRHVKYVDAKIKALNQGVRNYNLQCPSTGLHKWKLTQANEIDRSFLRVFAHHETLLKNHFTAEESSENVVRNSGGVFQKLFSSKSSSSLDDRSHLSYNGRKDNLISNFSFWSSLQKVFRG